MRKAKGVVMRKAKGFTLVELMITVAVVAILVSLALPAYRAFVLRSNRTAAIEAILTAAACEERIYSRTGQYSFDNTCKSTPDNYSKLVITKLNAGQGFRVVAIPKGGQAADPCKRLRMDHTGKKTLSGGPTKTVAECWAGR